MIIFEARIVYFGTDSGIRFLFEQLVFILAHSKTISMGKQHFDEDSSRKYTLTIILSFAGIFVFVMLMMLWRGDYKPGETSPVQVLHGPADRKVDMRNETSHADSTSNVK